MKQESLERAKTSIEIEIESIQDAMPAVGSKGFADAVDVLANAKRVMTCASGTSGIAAKKFAHSLCCIEIGAQFMPPCEAVHGGLGALKEGDALVMVSRGGKTAELLPIIAACSGRGAKLIAVTENMDSPLAKAADVIVPLAIRRESDPCNMMATASYVQTIALFDALLSALMEETGYRREQFASIHPGGAVGEMLNHK